MTKVTKTRTIGHIGNYYGDLRVTEYEGKYFWVIEDRNYCPTDISKWEEISKELYDLLIKHDDQFYVNNF
jgi:hypothetical protein